MCFRQECLRVSSNWQLFVTDPSVSGKQYFVLESEDHSWALKRIDVSENMFEKQSAKLVELRLPTSVVEKLKNDSGRLPLQYLHDNELYKINSDQAWSTHWRMPIESNVTSTFWSIRTPPNGAPYAHTGVDLRAAKFTPVKAVSDGTVVSEDHEVIYGNVLTIDHGRGVVTRYMHLEKFQVKIGDNVKAGEVIALSGSTGRAEAPHLHWEFRVRGHPADPIDSLHLLARLAYPE